MGIDVSGGMLVGNRADSIDLGDEYEFAWEFAEEHGMVIFSAWYDAGVEGQYIGFRVEDVDPLSEEFFDWVTNVTTSAKKFKEITGCDATLIGMQDVY